MKDVYYTYCAELYYAKRERKNDDGDKDMNVLKKDVFLLSEHGVGYRNPFQDPLRSFIFNQPSFHGYLRVLNCKKEVVFNVFFYNDDLRHIARAYVDGQVRVRWETEEGDITFDCDTFDTAVICQRIKFKKKKEK